MIPRSDSYDSSPQKAQSQAIADAHAEYLRLYCTAEKATKTDQELQDIFERGRQRGPSPWVCRKCGAQYTYSGQAARCYERDVFREEGYLSE